MKQKRTKDQGFSLVGTLVGAAVAGAVLLSVGQTILLSTKSSKRFDAKLALIDLERQLFTILKYQEICTLNWGKDGVAVKVDSLPYKFNVIQTLNEADKKEDKYKIGGIYEGNMLQVTGFELRNFEILGAPPTQKASLDLAFTVEITGDTVGTKQLVRFIHLEADLAQPHPSSDNSIDSCRAVNGNESSSNIWTKNADDTIHYSSGRVGINSETPEAALHIQATANGSYDTAIMFDSIHGNHLPRMVFRKHKGTPAAPDPVQANDPIAAIYTYGYDGTGYKLGPLLFFNAETDYSPAQRRSNFVVAIPNDPATSPPPHGQAPILRVNSDGVTVVNGDLTIRAGSFNNPSDESLKNYEGSFTKGLKEILQLDPLMYTYKDSIDSSENKKIHVGVYAQDVQNLIPHAVKEDTNGKLLLNQKPIFWTMANAIKDLNQIIEDQRTLLDQLQTEQKQLKEELAEIKKAQKK